MKTEMFWFVATVLMTSLMWVPYILNAIVVRGTDGLGNPHPGQKPLADWANRAKMAHYNAVENLVIFAPLFLLTQIHPTESALPATVSMIYFWVRLAHYCVYTFGIPVVRTLLFTAGFICQLVLAIFLLPK